VAVEYIKYKIESNINSQYLKMLYLCSYSFQQKPLIFTALHVMQTRYCDEISVRLSVRMSVCLSVRRVICDKMEKDRSRFLYHTKEHLA